MSLPTLRLDPATLADLDADLDREWLVTNGLGGYAMGSVCGATTRSYHGLLVAAVRPPVDRAVLVTKVDETVTTTGGTVLALGTNEYAGGVIDPRGFERLAGFTLDGLVAHFSYRLSDSATLEKRIWMAHGHNITFVHYRYLAQPADGPITLSLAPYCLDRDHHSFTRGASDWRFLVDAEPSACTVRAFAGSLPYRLIMAAPAHFATIGEWDWHIFHRAEHQRGLEDTEDVYLPGRFSIELAPGATATLVLSAEPELPPDLAGIGGAAHEAAAAAALDREQSRCAALLDQAGANVDTAPLVARLTLAADQFIVARPVAGAPDSTGRGDPPVTVIAGYPWFTDWGRDTMIALPGLTLATRRYAEARGLLRTFARYVDQGMIPNRFPDGATEPEYNTVDATLWYFHALGCYLDATQDEDLLRELFPLLEDIISWHVRGTRYGIGVDATDGLLRAGAPGVQLTWMDAKVGDWVVTPRWGKPVEINALWYAALAHMGDWARWLGRDAATYDALRQAVERSFMPRFWYETGGYLYDVVDVEGRQDALDWSLRPNQVVALALAKPLLSEAQARSILALVDRELLTPLGLRTLTPDDPHFIGAYGGDQRARDAAYHQGIVWPWLLGAYADACTWVYGDTTHAHALLVPFTQHLLTDGVGTASEIAEGVAPYAPRGCIAQAWSVSELLRIATKMT